MGRLDQREASLGMLRRLTIGNFGLIPAAAVDFDGGATMFTGETGSGKTMILGAIAFALGERSSADVVRRGTSRAAVTLEFEPSAELRAQFAGDGFDLDDDEDAVISREMSDAGKSAIRVNGRPATASYVRDIAAQVADIIGQHEAQRLLQPSYHLELLDRFGGPELVSLLARVGEAYDVRGELAGRLAELERDERRAEERLAHARFGLEEIEGAAPESGEDDRLTDRRRYLDNIERIMLALRSAHDALAGEEASAADALGAASNSLDAISSISSELSEMASAVRGLQEEANDVAIRISRHLDESEFDPNELENVNARLDVLDKLKRKYGETLDAVLASAQEFRQTIALVENRDEIRAALRAELTEATERLEMLGEDLTTARKAAAKRLRDHIEAELHDLAMPHATFDVEFETLKEMSRTGAETAQFGFAANAGEELRPLARVASGGELSRVLLALVVVLSATGERTALIFDEIDAGIGGATASSVGLRLGRLSARSQVICVTHLAQIASWADRHYVLEKRDVKGATVIEVREVDASRERTAEIARMLSGEAHDAALRHAKTLLAQTRERRETLVS